MSVAFVVSQFPKPSETFVMRELLSLRRLGLEVRPFAFAKPNPEEISKLSQAGQELLSQVDYLSPGKILQGALTGWGKGKEVWADNAELQKLCMFKSNQPMRLLRALALATRFKTQGITHIHAHWPYASQVAFLVHKLTGIPLSASIHAHEVEHDYGHFPKVFPALSFAAFCNRAAMERLLSRLPESARDRSHLIYHGVNLNQFRPLPYPTTCSPLRILSAGRLTRTKGFDRLVRACGRFHAEGGEVELTILGQGAMAGELKQISAELGFADQLHLPGWIPHSEVSTHLAQSHLFALMADTNYHDGLPNVVLEAQASARPIILSPLPAAAEAVTDGQEGFILRSAQDEEGLVKLLGQIAAAPEKLAEMGRASRERMEAAFDEDLHTAKLKELLESLTRQPLREPLAA